MKKSLLIFLITAMMAAAPIQSFAAEAGTKPNPDIGVEQEEPELEEKEKTVSGTGQTEEIVEEFLYDEIPELEKWYQSLSPKQKGFAQRKGIERIEKEELAKLESRLESRKRGLEDIQNYLAQKLQKSSYTYFHQDLNLFENLLPVLEVGVPNMKSMEKIKKEVEEYREKNKISPSYFNDLDNEYVEVDYRLCKYSLKELEKAKREIEKDKTFQKISKDRVNVEPGNGCLFLSYYFHDKVMGLEEWSKNCKYSDMIVCVCLKPQPN